MYSPVCLVCRFPVSPGGAFPFARQSLRLCLQTPVVIRRRAFLRYFWITCACKGEAFTAATSDELHAMMLRKRSSPSCAPCTYIAICPTATGRLDFVETKRVAIRCSRRILLDTMQQIKKISSFSASTLSLSLNRLDSFSGSFCDRTVRVRVWHGKERGGGVRCMRAGWLDHAEQFTNRSSKKSLTKTA